MGCEPVWSWHMKGGWGGMDASATRLHPPPTTGVQGGGCGALLHRIIGMHTPTLVSRARGGVLSHAT
jgi:hypothetical protein